MATNLAKLEDANVQSKFISIYQAVHKVDRDDAENFLKVETFNYKRALSGIKNISGLSEMSIAGTFLEIISNGLSFDSSAKHIYLIPRGKSLTYIYQADALIFLATSAGSIKSCSAPTLVFEGDEISVKTVENRKVIEHTQAIPRKTNKILGGFCTLTMPDGTTTGHWVAIEEVERLKKYSAKSGGLNKLYVDGPDKQIDEGFFKTKIVKSALKNIRKKKTLTDFEITDETLEHEHVYDTIEEPTGDIPEPSAETNSQPKEELSF